MAGLTGAVWIWGGDRQKALTPLGGEAGLSLVRGHHLPAATPHARPQAGWISCLLPAPGWALPPSARLCEAVPLPSEQEPALDLGHPPPGSPPACSLLTSGLCAHTLRSSCCCPPLLHPHQPVSLGQPLVGEGIPPRGRPRTGPPPASLVHGWAESLGCGPPSTGHLGPRGSFQEPLSLPGWTLSLTPRPSQTGLAMRATCGARCLF